MWLPKGVFFVHKKETHGHNKIHSLKKKWKIIAKQYSCIVFEYARKQMGTTILDNHSTRDNPKSHVIQIFLTSYSNIDSQWKSTVINMLSCLVQLKKPNHTREIYFLFHRLKLIVDQKKFKQFSLNHNKVYLKWKQSSSTNKDDHLVYHPR